MRLFRKLFAEKILRFYEGTNAGIRYISNAPLIGRCVKENTFAENPRRDYLLELWHSYLWFYGNL